MSYYAHILCILECCAGGVCKIMGHGASLVVPTNMLLGISLFPVVALSLVPCYQRKDDTP